MPTNVFPTGLARDLRARADSGKPIRIGLVGSGEMGTDIVTQVAHMPGLAVGAISELRPSAAGKAVDIAYREAGHWQEVKPGSSLNAIMEQGKVAVTNDVNQLLESELIDVVIAPKEDVVIGLIEGPQSRVGILHRRRTCSKNSSRPSG